MKAILVINVPDDFLADPSNAYRLQIGGDAKVYYVRQGEKRGSIIGDTRDIKPMPEKYIEREIKIETERDAEICTHGITLGRNLLIEELEK